MGVLDSSILTRYGMQMGSALEMILFSIALGDRLRWVRDENERIQAETSRMLETRVSERTDQLNAALRELSASHQRLERMTRLDPLTEVQNRRGLREAIDLACEQGRTDEAAIVMLDMDHFKALNDTHGHSVGDEVLRQVAALIVRNVREGVDTVARYGGEEFAILMPGADAGTALAVADRIREAIASQPLAEGDTGLRVTASVGVAVGAPGAGVSASDLMDRADAALYEAKAAGRNRTVRASA